MHSKQKEARAKKMWFNSNCKGLFLLNKIFSVNVETNTTISKFQKI